MSYKKCLAMLGIMAITATTVFTGCAANSGSTTDTTVESSDDADSDTSSDDGASVSGKTSVLDTSDMFTKRDLKQDYDEEDAIEITLSGDTASCDDSSVTIDGSTVTITAAGVYVLTGTLDDGQIIVNADKENDKVQIVLKDTEISTTKAAAIFVKSADKTFITTAEGTKNTLSATGDTETDSETDSNVDGTIFSKDDLVLNGLGTLTITSKAGNGIVSKDDLKITGGTIDITAGNHGIQANDSVRIADGTVTINSGNDGIHSDNDEDSDKGYVYMLDGDFTIKAADDGVHASGWLVVDGGTINVTESYEGLEGCDIEINDGTITVKSSDDGFNAAGGADSSGTGGMGGDSFGPGGGMSASGDNTLTINGGTIEVDADGDGIDSNGDLYINGGTIYVSGPTNDGNGALDIGDNGTGTITGGVLIAAGSSGMAEQFAEDGTTQGTILLTLDSYTTGEVTVKDSDGNVIASYTPTKQYNAVNISAPEIKDGETYTITCGDTTNEVTMSGLIYGDGGMGFGGGRGGFGGGMRGGFNGGDMDGNGDGNFNGGDGSGDGNGNFGGRGLGGGRGGFGGQNGGTPPEMPDGAAPDGQGDGGSADQT